MPVSPVILSSENSMWLITHNAHIAKLVWPSDGYQVWLPELGPHGIAICQPYVWL